MRRLEGIDEVPQEKRREMAEKLQKLAVRRLTTVWPRVVLCSDALHVLLAWFTWLVSVVVISV